MNSGHVVSIKLYSAIFGALLVMTLATAGAAFIDLGGNLNTVCGYADRGLQGVAGDTLFHACALQQPTHLGFRWRRIFLADDSFVIDVGGCAEPSLAPDANRLKIAALIARNCGAALKSDWRMSRTSDARATCFA